jgi:phosphoglycolate phosphatase
MNAPATPDWRDLRPGRRLRAVVFDLDDTLVESTVDFPKFKSLVIRKIGEFGDDPGAYSLSETIVAILERFERRMAERGSSEAEVRRMLSELDRIMDSVEMEKVEGTAALPGAREVLEFLRARDVKVGVLTRGCAEYASRALALTGMASLVDAMECRNSRTRPKPYPDSYLRLVGALGVDKEETVFVGDHPIDAQCAANAGVPFLAVMTGDVPEEVLAGAGSIIVARDVGQLTGFFGRATGH